MDFKPFKTAVAKQFDRMQQHPLFRTSVEKDALWETYLGSFPEGTNPMFKERTEHDCNCCKSFIRAVGSMVAIIDGKLESIWDIQVGGPYQVVADALATLAKSQPIQNTFLHTERVAGVDKNFSQLLGEATTWEHFFINLPASLVNREPGSALSDSRATRDVMLRGLTEISLDAIDTVLELIAQNSLYRGDEHKNSVTKFRKLKLEFDALNVSDRMDADRDVFVWSQVKSLPHPISRIRNTSIGTLLVDLSTGKEMEDAVKAFEAMVAPANYKRPTSVATPTMIRKAKETVEGLNLMSALERRYATLADITINNVLFADRMSQGCLANGNVFDVLAVELPSKPKNLDKIEEISIEKFITDVVPRAESIELLVENRHTSNLVSLVAPVDPTAGKLFKWDNPFSWSYNGDLADSIKERVKKAGGNVSGDLCCRLAWYNHDDLDFHMVEPDGSHIYYGTKVSHATRGELDVDMNAGYGKTREPVENIVYQDKRRMTEGVYRLYVNQFNRRETTNNGFEVEVDFMGTVYHFAYDKSMKSGENVDVISFRYTHANGLEVLTSLPSSKASKTVWGIPTETFHKVNVVMHSPNHWDGHGVGNRHVFFMLDGCKNDDQARGFYNEFLRNDLEPHRKAFELVGSKMRTEESDNQLSGLGFSTTQRNHAIVRVKGSFTRQLKVTF